MSKRSEELALHMYPVFMWYDNNLYCNVDANLEQRVAYRQGYEQAEQDLKLTWEDVKTIFKIADNYENELNKPKYLTQDYCQEILNRFNEQRKK